MNKHHYKVIFSRVLNQLVVVSELAKSAGKAAVDCVETHFSSNSNKINGLGVDFGKTPLTGVAFALMLSLGFVWMPQVQAQEMVIRADKSAPGNQQPTVLKTANGLPQVNIQTPSAGGVSRNQYTQFDVAEQGAILNNARKAAQTQMAGWVQGNPNLARGEAKVILNEVNSANPSRLKGYVEVAGKKADVVIANPNGIHCDGCGVINAGRATLTTGKAEVENGNLKGYRVQGGKVSVGEKGMDNRQADYTDIISEKAEIKGGVWSNKGIKVTTGKNKVDRTNDSVVYVGEQAEANTPTTPENQSTYSVDVSQLGGMYAEKIHLVDNGQGLGVRNAGHIGASAGDVKIDSQGKIVNEGHIQAQENALVAASELHNAQGASLVAHKGKASVSTKGEIKQNGQILAKKKIDIESASLEQSVNGEIVGGDVRLETQGAVVNQGLINARHAEEGESPSKTVIKGSAIQNIGSGRIYGDKVALGTALLENLDEKDAEGNVVSATIAAREQLDVGAKRILNQSRFYTGNTDGATAMVSLGRFSIGDALDENDESTGKADKVENRSALMQGRGGVWRVGEVVQTNDFFETEVNVVSEKNVDRHYIVPKGESEQRFHLDMSLLQHYSGVRGKNGYRVKLLPSAVDKPKNGDVLSFLLPSVAICQDVNCDIQPETYYLPNDPAWKVFGIYTQQRNHIERVLSTAQVPVEPIKPSEPANLANLDEAAKAAYQTQLNDYQQALKNYQLEKAEFDKTIKPLYVQWMKDNEAQFNALATAIENHNAAIAAYVGRKIEDYWITNVNKEVIRATTVTQSQPAKIVMDGEMTVDTDKFTNDKSQVLLGGALHLLNAKIDNINAEGMQYTEAYGDKKYSRLLKRKSKTASGRNKYKRRETDETVGRLYTDSRTITLPVANVFTDYTFDAHELANENDRGMSLPSSSLYKVNPTSNNQVLVETDPQFTDRRKWLSSDYMFKMLRADPQNILKRLGDGYYEQQLIRNQLNQLTGRPFLDNYANFEAQYKALMDNAVTAAGQFHLMPGVALSKEQVQALTSDIVWFEPKTVTLKDGSQQVVLAPKVYLSKTRQEDIKNSGVDGRATLISADQIIIDTDKDVHNQAQMAARTLTYIQANNIHNDGKINGQQVALLAENDITGAGRFEADNALLLQAGKQIALNSTTATNEVKSGGYRNSQTHIDRQATVYVKGENGSLTLAAENIALNAVNVINDGKGQTRLHATDKLELGTVMEQSEQQLGGSSNHRKHEKATKAQVTRVHSQGDVTLQANTMTAEGTQLQSKGALQLSATEALRLGTTTENHSLEEYHKDKTKRLGGSESHESYLHTESQTQQATQLNGQSVKVAAGGDLTAVATQVLATGDLIFTAGGKLNLESAIDSEKRIEWEKHQKSGLTSGYSGGVARVGYEKSNHALDGQASEQQAKVAQLTSKNGDVMLLANKALTLDGSHLDAGGEMLLSGSEVKVNAVYDRSQSEQHSRTKVKGVGVRATIDEHAVKKQQYQDESANGSTQTLVGKIINFVEATDKANHQIANRVAGYGYRQQTESHHYAQSETAKGAELSAKGNLTIQAREADISAQGGQYHAGKDLQLNAKGNVLLEAAQSWQSSRNEQHRKGANYDGAQRADGMFGVYNDKSHGIGENSQQQGALMTAGGTSSIVAQTGNISAQGLKLISEQNAQLQAGKDIRLTTAVEHINTDESSTKRAVGAAKVSDTERFFGYHRELSSKQQGQTVHSGSLISSLNGDVKVNAGGEYQQTSSELLAKNKISVDAASIKTDTVFNEQSLKSHESDLKIGNFTRVKSPIIDLINTIESTVKNKDASDRVKAANLMSIAAQGYNALELAKEVDISNWSKNPTDAGYLLRIETGTGFSHHRDNREGWEKISQANRMNAKDIELNAHSGKLDLTHTDLTSRDKTGQRLADSHISLYGRDGIDYQAGLDLGQYKGRQQNSGVEVGTAVSVGAKTGWSFYLQLGFGQGKQDSEFQTVRNSQIDTERLSLKTGDSTKSSPQANAHLRGVTAKARVIETDIQGDLTVESLQSHAKSKNTSSGLNLQVEGGFGSAWGASVGAQAAKGTTEYHQVLEQAGLFAEDHYNVKADNVHLKGAAITGQNPEANRLETNALTFEDIHNHSSSKASSGSLNLNLKQTADEQIDNKTGKVVKENAPDSTLVKGERSGGVNGGLPMSQSDSDSSLTKATLSEGTIILTKDTTPIATTAKALGINTELAQANPQVETPKDVNKQLDEQRQIREAAGHIQTAVNKYIDVQQKAIAKEIKVLQSQKEAAEARGDSAQANALDEQILNARISQDQWGTGGEYKRATEALTQAVLMGVSGGSAQAIAAAGASPYVNQVIKDVTKDIPSLNLPAHVIWGAIEAELTGGSATTGAISTAAGELGAAYLAEHIFGKKAAELSPEERSKVRDAAKAIAGIAGGLSSAMQGQDLVSSLNDTSVGLTVANNAVENNYLSIADVQNLIRELSKAQKEGRDTKPILEKYKGISEENRQQLIACNGNVACETAHLHEMNTGAEELERNLGFFSRMVVYYPNDLNTANRIALSNLVESEYAESFSKLSDTIKFGLNAMEAGTAIGLGAVAGYAKVGLSNVKSLINGKNKTYPPSGMDGYKRTDVGEEDYRSSGAGNAYVDPRTEKLKSVLPTGQQMLDPSEVSFSQATVSYQKKGKDYNYDTMVEDMRKNGWNGKPVDVVNMPDNAPTSMDNTRILAAREAGIKVEANVHSFNEKLTAREVERFQVNGVFPNTWGEAILLRIEKQGTIKGDGIPNNWNIKYPHGSIYDPKVKK